jgi:hypothetical protein
MRPGPPSTRPLERAPPAGRRDQPRSVSCGTSSSCPSRRIPRPITAAASARPTTRAWSSRRTSANDGSSAWLTRHPWHFARLTQHRGALALMNRQYPGQKTIGRLQVGHLGLGTSTSRPAAA